MRTHDSFIARRETLHARLGRPVLLLGNGERARNLPMTALPFRQDSSFLYFTGCSAPDAALLLDDDGSTLFLPVPPEGDDLWHGPGEPREAVRERMGVDRVRPASELESAVEGRTVASIAVPDATRNRWLERVVGGRFRFGTDYGDLELVDAIIAMRRVKSDGELDHMRRAATHTERAFRAVMGATRPGVTERALTALFQGVLAAKGCTTGYEPILTVRGEILHNHSHEGTLAAGDLLLLDGGGEVPSGYGVDITRTWPVTGTCTAQQREVMLAVVEAQDQAIAACRAGVRYREVHDTACRVLADFLRQQGLLRCSVDEALSSGAHGVFYPHGTGHHLGLDVHDLENFGDRSSYEPGKTRSDLFGTRNLRLDLPLEPGWVVTVEPGIYFVPAILTNKALRQQLGDRVDWERAATWLGFGGIRIEDDIAITASDPENLTGSIPRTPTELERVVGQGASIEDRLS